MKRKLLAAALLLALAAPSSRALALGPGFSFGVHANFTSSSFPGPSVSWNGMNSSIGSAYGAGWGGGVHVDANLMVFSFRLSGDYMHYSINDNKFRDFLRPFIGDAATQMSISGGGLGIFALTVNGKMPVLPLPIVTPYITGGIGLAWVNRDGMTTAVPGFSPVKNPSDSESNKTTVAVGVGADVKLGISLYVEVKYAWIFTDVATSTYVPVTVGVTF